MIFTFKNDIEVINLSIRNSVANTHARQYNGGY